MAFTDRLANRGSISTAAYSIDNSVLLAGANCDGQITQTAGDRKTHTISFWHKRAFIGMGTGDGEMDGAGEDMWGTSSEGDTLRFGASDLTFFNEGGTGSTLVTDRKFRDCAAWYHFVVAIDTTQAVAANRIKIYVNGVQETSFSTDTYPDEDDEFKLMENSQVFYIGAGHGGATAATGQGYYADFIIVDGAAKAASDFGEFNDDGIWVPKEYTGDFNTGSGTNGAHYKFAGTAEGTGAGSTGLDSSGESNNMNFRNQVGGLTDTPTNNFCTLNPLWVYGNAITTGPTNGNLKVDGGSWAGTKATMGVDKGKWYWEWKTGGSDAIVGIQTDEGTALTGNAHNILSTAAIYDEFWIKDSTSGRNDTDLTWTRDTNEVMSLALNMDDNQISIYQDGTLITNAGDMSLDGLSNTYVFPFAATYNVAIEFNFGNPIFAIASGNADENGYGNFEHAPPSGYYALCTKNLAEFG